MKHLFQFLLFSLTFGYNIPGQSQDPFIPRYDAVKRSERCFTLTYEANQQVGSVWLRDKIDFSKDTVLNFSIYLGDGDANGGDGIAFVIHQDPRDTFKTTDDWIVQYSNATYSNVIDPYRKLIEGATGGPTGGLGYAAHYSNEYWDVKIAPSVALEFDTWNNNDYQDGKGFGYLGGQSYAYGWDHTSVVYNGDLYNQQKLSYNGDSTVVSRTHPLKPVSVFGTANNPDGSVHHNIEDDRCYAVQIRWKVNGPTQTLTVAMGLYTGVANFDNLKPIMHHTDTMLNLFDDTKLLRVGFTGSTGGSINEQTICFENNTKVLVNDDIATTQANTPAYIDVFANDSDPSGNNIGPGYITDSPSHGYAQFVTYQGKEHLLYTPISNFSGYDTLYYMRSDVNSAKCYAQMDTAEVVIKVEAPIQPIQYSGMITDRSGNPIDDFPVEITADGQTNSRKTSKGRYSGEVGEKSDITIIPKGEVRANMGVTTLDLILTRMQILGIRSMDAYQKVAADVNRSGSISAMDVTEMKQIILHKKEDFDNAPSLTCINQGTYVETSPFHFDEQYQFELHNDTTGLDFVVVKTGDVNSSWDHSLSNQRQTEFDDKMELMVKYEQHYDDVMVTIQATKDELKDKLGLQMSVSWSTDELYLNQASQLDKDMEVNLNNRDNGWATLLWMPEEANQISDGDIIDLIKFRFKANREDDLPKVNFTSVPTEALAYDKDFKSYKLIFNENILADREILVYPNPASQLLKLAGTTAGNEYKILNQLGEVVLTGNINPGLEVNVSTLSPGVYFIAVENNDLPQTYRFVKE